MIAIGVVAFAGTQLGERIEGEERARSELVALVVDDRSVEAVAESYLDAWRRRSWRAAEGISIDAAREAVREKRARDEAMDPEDRDMARGVWERLASAPLRVDFVASENLGEEAIALSGVANYDFMGNPYRREVRWEVVPAPDGSGHFRVRRMEMGEVLTETPRLLEGIEP